MAKLVGFRLGSEEIYVNPDHVVLVEKSGEGSIIYLIGRRSNPPTSKMTEHGPLFVRVGATPGEVAQRLNEGA